MRADRLGCYGNRKISTPNIDALAKSGTLFTEVSAQVPALAQLMETRAKLRDLMSKVDRSEELETLLEQVLSNESELKNLSAELGLDKKEG